MSMSFFGRKGGKFPAKPQNSHEQPVYDVPDVPSKSYVDEDVPISRRTSNVVKNERFEDKYDLVEAVTPVPSKTNKSSTGNLAKPVPELENKQSPELNVKPKMYKAKKAKKISLDAAKKEVRDLKQNWKNDEAEPMRELSQSAAVMKYPGIDRLQNFNRMEKREERKVDKFQPKLSYNQNFLNEIENATANKLARGLQTTEQLHHEINVYKLIEEAFLSGKTAPYGRTKLMVVGEGRAGKTSTIRSLLGQAFNEDELSTKGFDVTRVDASNWKEDDSSYVAEHLQRALNEKKADGKPAKSGKSKEAAASENAENDAPEIEVSREEMKKYGESVIIGSGANAKPLSFTIWDFGGQKVFYTLHHLFLTEYGLYLLVFDMKRLLNPTTSEASVDYLKFWLYSKKLHAPNAPILLLGTHADELSSTEIGKVDKILMTKVLGHDTFNEYRNGQYTFFPIDNVSHTGIDDLKKKIEAVVLQQSYVNDEIPLSYLRTLELLLEEKKDYIRIKEVEAILKKCGLSKELFHHALTFLNNRGLITYFDQPRSLRHFVILQPQWLISGITDIIFDENEHLIPRFDEGLNSHFRRFIDERVISNALLKNIWDKKGYIEEIQSFFKSVMMKTSLMCLYKFDAFESYLIPTLFCTSYNDLVNNSLSEENFYKGPYFVLDFSGDYEEDIVNDANRNFVRYLPFGIFERLICLCVEHSATMPDSIKPEIKESSAKLSFGVDVDFELKTARNLNREDLWIKVVTEDGTSYRDARELVKTIYSMLDGLKEDYFSKGEVSDDSLKVHSNLSISLLLPSSAETDNVLAEYQTIMTKREENAKAKFRPSKVSRLKVYPKDFNCWFDSGVEDTASGDLLNTPDNQFQKLQAKDPQLMSLQTVPAKHRLPNNLLYHAFLSYKQSSAIDIVGKLYYILTYRGYKCWYDQQYEESINIDSMTQGIAQSMAYVLILSQDIFKSAYVIHEIETAVKLNKPIILMHHPSTGEVGYAEFSDYINEAPAVLKPYFKIVESLPLQRRHYLEQAVTNVLEERLQAILKQM